MEILQLSKEGIEFTDRWLAVYNRQGCVKANLGTTNQKEATPAGSPSGIAAMGVSQTAIRLVVITDCRQAINVGQ